MNIKNKQISMIMVSLMIFSGFSLISASSEINESMTILIHFDQFRYLEQQCDKDAKFKLECVVGEEQFVSPIWDISYFGVPLNWNISIIITEELTEIDISISLYKSIYGEQELCDLSEALSPDDNMVNIMYNLETGWWNGDDSHGDLSGYGRLNGCDDGSIYEAENDAELWFTIIEEDLDGDNIPQAIEEQYGLDPLLNDADIDYDQDGIPTEWEWYFGYHPKEEDDHLMLDPDNDSITNYEEFITWNLYNSDPFRKDIFLEIDWMEPGPNGEISEVPKKAEDRIYQPFHRRNIVFHFDSGIENGGELIPFSEKSSRDEVLDIYEEYFIHHGQFTERRSIFHYGIVVYLCDVKGYGFSGDTGQGGYSPGTNAFVISSSQMELNTQKIYFKDRSLDNFYGSAMMHEMGHNFGIRFGEPFGCDNWFAKYPWQPLFWFIRNYKSMMNYQYTYSIFDYSDGSHGRGDFDDWNYIDLTYFEYPDNVK